MVHFDARSMIKFLSNISRSQDWIDTKLNWYLLSLSLIFISKRISLLNQDINVLYFVALIIVYAFIVSIANDFGDIEEDLLLKKNKVLSSLSPTKVKVLLSSLVLIFEFLLYFWLKAIDYKSILITLFLFISIWYSLPPFRFKEKGWLGLLTGSLIQRPLPACIIFLLMNYWNFSMILYLLFLTILGIRLMIVHQIKDYDNDIKTKTKTLATNIGLHSIAKLEVVAWCLELLVFITFIITFNVEIKSWLLILAYSLYLLMWLSILLSKHAAAKKLIRHSTTNSFMADWYYWWLPVSFAVLLGIRTHNWLLSGLLVILQKFHLKNFIKKIW